MDLAAFQSEVNVWSKRNFAGKSNAQISLLGVGEEFGELCHAYIKYTQGIRGVSEADMKDAVGDLIVYLADFCGHMDIDMEDAVRATWATVQQRDWIKFPKNGRTE